jgi:F-type H+-transporting ATPase subunit a
MLPSRPRESHTQTGQQTKEAEALEGLFPEVLFDVLGVPVRDTVVSTWFMVFLIVAVSYLLGKRKPELLEMVVQLISDSVSSVLGRPVDPYLPFLGSLAIFIAAANAFGAVPVFVTPTRDINTPAALALVVFFSVHYFGLRERGLSYATSLANPLEVISQLSRTLSLTLRLFGNVISTELITLVVSSLVPLIVPLVFIGFSMFTGVLQAYIFTVLAAVYIDAAVRTD